MTIRGRGPTAGPTTDAYAGGIFRTVIGNETPKNVSGMSMNTIPEGASECLSLNRLNQPVPHLTCENRRTA